MADHLRIFSELLAPFVQQQAENYCYQLPVKVPVTDIKQTDSNYQLTILLPGVTRENVHISMEDNVLSVKANRESKDETDLLLNEIPVEFSVERNYKLPGSINGDIKAKLVNGILTIEVSRPPESNRRVVEIL